MQNANDALREYICSDNFYQFHFGLLITDGAKAFADKFEAYWFLDVIASYYPNLNEEFQVWKLKVNEDASAVVECGDGNDRQIVKQTIPFTDFKARTATLWVEGNVVLLPSEH